MYRVHGVVAVVGIAYFEGDRISWTLQLGSQ